MNVKLIAQRYELAEEIGSGGEARVLRARDNVTGRDVAVRLPHSPGSAALKSPLLAPHSGWVQLLDQGIDAEGGSFQVYELLLGKTLAESVQHGALDPNDWLNFVHQSLDAVEALHRAGWAHGDLNAQNFLCISGAIWKLLELPFLRFTPPEKRSALFGSIYTLAPEQLRGLPPDLRSDLYSLGCLYYYAASGDYPSVGDRAPDLVVDRLRFPAAPLREKAPRFPRR